MERDRKKDYHHGELKQALLREGLAEIERGGWASFSMRLVAKSLDVSPAAPLHHYKSRTAYAAALAAIGFDRLQGLIQRQLSKEVPALDRLQAAFVAYTRFAIDNAELYRTMFSAELSDEAEAYDMRDPNRDHDVGSLVEAKGHTFDVFMRAVRDAQSAGYLRAGDAQRVARTITSQAHGLASEFIDEKVGSRISRRREAEEIFRMLYSGLVSHRRQVRITTFDQEDPNADMRDTTPAERVGMMKTLAENAWSMTGPRNVDSELSRSHIRIQRRRR